MSTVKTRLGNLELFSRKKKGSDNFVEEVRQMLQGIDGQVEIGMLPEEDLFDVMVRRLEGMDGYTLALMPGDTLRAKMQAVDDAAQGKLTVSPEARHAACAYFSLYEGL